MEPHRFSSLSEIIRNRIPPDLAISTASAKLLGLREFRARTHVVDKTLGCL